jgi:hypothetical protein
MMFDPRWLIPGGLASIALWALIVALALWLQQ